MFCSFLYIKLFFWSLIRRYIYIHFNLKRARTKVPEALSQERYSYQWVESNMHMYICLGSLKITETLKSLVRFRITLMLILYRLKLYERIYVICQSFHICNNITSHFHIFFHILILRDKTLKLFECIKIKMLMNKYRFILGKLMATKLPALVTFWPQLSQWKTISMEKIVDVLVTNILTNWDKSIINI